MSCKRQPGLYVAADLSGLKVTAQNGFPSVQGSVGVQREGTAQEGVLVPMKMAPGAPSRVLSNPAGTP